jgi:SAM-dependent methyltransferase
MSPMPERSGTDRPAWRRSRVLAPARAFARRAPRRIRFGSLRRREPISSRFGFDRGTPIDRVYIERFLAIHAADVKGRVLEFGDDRYTRRFGGAAIERSDVLDVDPHNARATILGDITDPSLLAEGVYDCVICTQVIQMVGDMTAALRSIVRCLRPGGVLLLTIPGISQIDRVETTTWHWAVTRHGARLLAADAFPSDATVEIEGHGNVLASIGFLHGLAAEDLRPAEIAARDPRYDLVVTVRMATPLA